MVKIWIDDVRPMPDGYKVSCNSVYDFMMTLTRWAFRGTLDHELLISLDHDAGEYARYGGDYIKILEWLEYLNSELNGYIVKDFKFHFKIHSGNPVGRENIIRIIERNGWNYIESVN